MEPSTASSCRSCGTLISAGEVTEGLAVRVDGHLICPLCVDTLPGSAQVKINQIRALRGLDVTTYRVPRAGAPKLNAFSFTTTQQMSQHRRALLANGRFDAPLLPTDHKPVPKLPPASRQAPHSKPPWMWIGIAAAGVILVGTMIGLIARPTTPSKLPTTVHNPETPERSRVDYPSDARQAWAMASTDPECSGEVVSGIAKELATLISAQLDVVDAHIAANNVASALDALSAAQIPDDIRFRSLRTRRDGFADKIAAIRVRGPTPPLVVDPDTTPAPQPGPVVDGPKPVPPQVAPTIPGPTVQPTPPAVTPNLVPPTPAIAESWLIDAQSLQERPGQSAWRAYGLTARELVEGNGTVSATFSIPPGAHRCWAHLASGAQAGAEVQVIIDGQRSAFLRLDPGQAMEWHAIAIPDLRNQTPECVIQVMVIGSGCILESLYITTTSGPTPEKAIAGGIAQALQPIPGDQAVGDGNPDAVEPPFSLGGDDPDTAVTAPNQPEAFTTPALEALGAKSFSAKIVNWDPLDLPTAKEARIDTPSDPEYTFPGNAGPFVLSEDGHKARRHVQITFPDPVSAGGGIALVVHPRRVERVELAAIFMDAEGRSTTVLCPLAGEGWSSLMVTAPNNAQPWTSVTIEDTKDLTTDFVLGRVVVSPSRAITVDDLGLRPRALLTPTYKDLVQTIHVCGVRRKQKDTRAWLQPSKIKILVAPQMTAGSWTTTLRKQLKTVFAVGWKGKDAPQKTTELLVYDDQFLGKVFSDKDPKKSLVQRDSHHMLVILSAGSELLAGATPEQAVAQFWKPIIEDCMQHGVIPIPVLGPNRVDDAMVAEADRMWVLLNAELDAAKLSLPLIDLRSAKALSADRMEAGGAQLAADLMSDALAELNERVIRIQKAGK